MRKIFLSIVFSLVFLGAFAQETLVQPEHEHKVYVDKENARIFVWDTGLYLYVGTENDDRAVKYQLINQASANQDEVAPFNLDTEGLNTIIEPSLKNRRIGKDKLSEFKLYADWSSPTTKVSASVKKKVKVEAREIRGISFDLSLGSNDKKKGSGVKTIYYSVNDSEYAVYEGPHNISKEGLYTFRYYAVDKVGNVEKAKTKYYGLDLTPPLTQHRVLSGNVGNILSPRAVLNLIATDGMAGVKKTYYHLDDKKEVKYKKTISVAKVAEGEHVLHYRSDDRIGNQEIQTDYPFYLDRTPPESSIEVDRDLYQDGDKSYVSERSKFTLTAYDAKVDVKNIYYSLNRGSNQIYEAPFVLTTSAVNHAVSFWSDDVLLNTSKPMKSSYILDIDAPSVFHEFNGSHFIARNINYINSTTKINFKSNDKLSGVQSVNYSVNGGTDNEDTDGFYITKQGEYELSYSAIDNVNNLASSKSAKIYVDLGIPKFDFEFGVKNLDGQTVKVGSTGNNIFPEKVFLYLYGTDDHSGIKSIRYSINGGVEQVYSSAISFDAPESYSINVKVIDNVDNVTESNVSFSVTSK